MILGWMKLNRFFVKMKKPFTSFFLPFGTSPLVAFCHLERN